MRNFLLLLAVIVCANFIAFEKASAQYCTTGLYANAGAIGCNDGSGGDVIQGFATSGGVTNISNLNSGCGNTSADAYTFYSSMTHSAVQGSTVNWTLQAAPSFGEGYKIWVDWNNDGDFDDAGENVFNPPATTPAGATITGSFVIPVSTVPGVKRMRVRAVYATVAFGPCTSNHSFGEIEDYNLQVIALTPCSGTPNAGTANSTITNILCPGANFTLGLTGSDLTSGLTYQWFSSPDNTNWTPIAGATNFNHTTTQTAPIMYYRAVVTCSNGGASATSGSVTVTNGSGPTYATLPYTESFENTWMNTCNTREIPNNSWRNTPGTGNNSWRRNDDGGAAAWTTPATGAYSPASSDGSFSARFHSNNAPAGATGIFDLHINANTAAANKRLKFDFINTSGNDSLSIHISTDGGANYVRLDSVRNSTAWRTKAVVFNSTSATTILRFIAYSDDGSTDIGLDNAKVSNFDDCSGTPVGGTASNNAPASVCAGVPFTLTVTGQTDAALLVYQWEVSTDGGSTWTPIAGANSETYVASQSTTSIYRLKITCTNGGAVAYSSTTTVTSPPIPNGNYIIDKTAPASELWPLPGKNKFQSFNAAYNAMSCGIGGPVKFTVQPGTGPYNEQLIMAPIINASATNTVTFKGNYETITFATTAAQKAVIKLNGADYITFDSLTIVPVGTANAFGVQLYNDANFNTISNNVINVNATVTATSLAGVVMSGNEADPIGTGTTTALLDGNQILNNTINGGYYGVTLTATFAGGANGNNIIRGNDIKDFYQYGIYVSASYGTIIDSNWLRRPTRTAVGAFEGIYFSGQSNTAMVERNRIASPFGGLATPTGTLTFNGINFNNASASAGNDNIVRNNLISCIKNTNAAVTGLANTGSSSVSYFHNTIALDDVTAASSAATRGLSVSGTPSGILFYNNLVVVTRGGSGQKHGIYLGGSLLLGSDYNNIWVSGSGSHFGFYGGNRTTLQNWITATAAASLDINSKAVNPVLLNTDASCNTKVDVCMGNAALDNAGLYIDVAFDINGNPRSTTAPDIGAFECTPPPCSIPPVTGTTVVTPTTICQNLPVSLSLNIGAYGSGQTFTWQWSDDNVTFTDLGTPMLTPDTVINADSTVWLRVKVTCTASAIEYTNSVLLTVNPAFPQGTYTINNGTGNPGNTYNPGVAGGNFTSFNAAYNAMATCGILGPVVFNVDPASGPYLERLKMNSIVGASAFNTITFNGNGRTITFDPALPPTSSERAVIKLSNADHITFDSLVIDASNGASFGYGVQLFNNADSNTFRRCNIISSLTSASNTYSGVVINASEANAITLGNTLCDGNTFEKNTITGGFYGITAVGSAATPINNNRFLSNEVRDFYSTGIYVAGTDNTIIDSNTITRPNRIAATALTGIFSTQAANNGLRISRNSLRNFTGANTAAGAQATVQQYGIYTNVDQATAAVVYNNLISDMGGAGNIYALYNFGADNVHYYHNTISLDSSAITATGFTRGYFQQGQAAGIEFKNNIVTIKRGGNATKHAIYIDNTTSTINRDYNVYWVEGSNAHIGFYPTTNRTTLSAWQNATIPPQELNSINTDPLYQNPAVMDYRPSIQTVDNLGTTNTSIAIPTDIKGVFRSSPPDMGAFEFAPIPCSAPVAGTASVSPGSNICLADPITLDITGHSQLGTLTFRWFSAPTASGPWTPISPIQYGPQFNTVSTPNTFFRAEVACNANVVTTNTVQLILNNVVVGGTYTIGNGPTTWNGAPPTSANNNFATFTDAVNAMQCGITDSVTFNVIAGTYNEQIRINKIRNSSAVNTITFQSNSGNPADVNLTFNATSAANYTLKLDSAEYVTFRKITISGTNPLYARVVDIANTAAYDSLVGNNIVAPAVTVTTNTASAVFVNAIKGSNIILKKNTITNGSNGIYFAGTSNAATGLALPGHLIDSNTVSSSYHTGIFVQYTDNMVVSNNTVNLNGPVGANAAGIHTNYADSGYRIQGNRININNSTATTYGLYVQNSRSVMADSGIVRSNSVVADAGNTGTVYGMTITLSKNLYAVNNTIGINTAGPIAYGIHSLNNEVINWYNNTSQLTTGSTNGYAAYFNHTAGGSRVYNNIFANKGVGRAMYINNPGNFFGDYNMIYSAGTNLIQTATGSPSNFTNLLQWKNTWNWDKNSLVGRPVFVSNTDLRPDIASDSSWLMHGRGLQIPFNSYDYNYNYRPQTLTEGVPDLGAFEFYPTAQPTVLQAFPATPAPNVEQTFVYGSDTVMKIQWGATAPPAIEVRRFSGVVPPGLQPPPRPDSMFFHVSVDVPGQPKSFNKFPYSAKLYYVESWMGSIPEEYMIGMGRKLESNAWVVGYNSRNNLIKNEISQDAMNYFDLFTGLINPVAQKDSDDSTSNRGKDFWVGYQRNYYLTGGNNQEMVIYMAAGNQQANVHIEIVGTSGTTWFKDYVVPPNSTVVSDFIPKTGPQNAALNTEGFHDNQGIHITSDVPIAAYAHIYATTNSGATMLMPTTVWGYEYYTLNNRQSYGSSGGVPSSTVFHVIAKEDSTFVEINPTVNTAGGWVPNGGTQPNQSYLVKLNKGDIYQVLGAVLTGQEGRDLSGSYVKSVSNNQGQCFPIAVFTGSTRTSIGCNGGLGSNGDLIIQQVFPYQAWGTKYATAPTVEEASVTTNMINIYRVLVKDTNTVVKRNNVILNKATFYNSIGRFYQFQSNTADYIESNKPVMVAQYMTSSGAGCYTGDGDPEMFILSPLEQAIDATQFYRNEQEAIQFTYITLVIPTDGLTSLRIDGVNWNTYPAGTVNAYNHPNIPNYSVVSKRWPGAPSGSSVVESDYPFTGIVYGGGGPESYGYNLGTLVKNLNNQSFIDNPLDPSDDPTGYTCENAPFTLTALLPVEADSIYWHLSGANWISPNVDSVQLNPVAIDTVVIDGVTYYAYTLNQQFIADTTGNQSITITYFSPELESCDKSRTGVIYMQILPAPVTDFTVSFSGGNPQACEGDIATFDADDVTANGIAVNQWNWTFHTGATPSGEVQTLAFPTPGTYPVKLTGITADGCISDTTKMITVNPKPPVTVASANVSVCPGDDATMSVSSPLPGATYNWYNVPTGGTILGTGTTFTATGVTPPASFWVEAISSAGCISVTRAQVDVTSLSQLGQPVVTFTGSTANSVTFSWSAISGAVGYEVSTTAGATWITPSSGSTGLTHTVSGMGILDDTCILVRVLGTLACQTNTSTSVCGCTNSPVVVVNPVVSVCVGTAATFTVQNPQPNVNYNWYATPTGGTPLNATPSATFTPNVTGTTNYYVEGSTLSGCISNPRTQVTANILAPLATPVVDSSSTGNSITWTWQAVPGAASYQVSLDGGATWITPSSGATGLSHTISGLPPVTRRCIIIRAVGAIACQSSEIAVCGRTKPDQIFIPNTFTPNGDGKNDVLIAYGWAIQTIQFAVFNQWGEKIYEVTTSTQDASTGGLTVWDGRYQGKVQPVGVYVYAAKIILKDGTTVQKSGALNIVR